MKHSEIRENCKIATVITDNCISITITPLSNKIDTIKLLSNAGYGICTLISAIALNLEHQQEHVGSWFLDTIQECIDLDKDTIKNGL